MTAATPTPRARPAFSLLEMLVSMAVMSVLLLGVSSAIVVSTRAIDVAAPPPAGAAQTNEALAEMTRELKFATAFSERAVDAVTFTIPDRTGDGSPETIRYSWQDDVGNPGAAKNPITRSYNGGPAIPVVDAADVFALSYFSRPVEGTFVDVGPDVSVLMVVPNPGLLDASATARKALFESWEWGVALIDDDDAADAFTAAAGDHDVAYVIDEVDPGRLDTKLSDVAIGVACEQKQTVKKLGIVEKDNREYDGTAIFIDDNAHYITEAFALGALEIFDSTVKLLRTDGPVAPGGSVLASKVGDVPRKTLVTVDAGAALWDATPAPGRRVAMPWGKDLNFGLINADGETLLKRAVEWAASKEVFPPTGVESDVMVLAFHDDAPGGQLKNQVITDDTWLAQFVWPVLPTNCLSWKITRVKIMAQKVGSKDDGIFDVQVRTADADEKPTATVLEAVSLAESSLFAGFTWIDADFATISGLNPVNGVCIVVQGISGHQDLCELRYERDGAPMTADTHRLKTTNAGGTWSDPDATEDTLFYLYGTVTTLGAPEWP